VANGFGHPKATQIAVEAGVGRDAPWRIGEDRGQSPDGATLHANFAGLARIGDTGSGYAYSRFNGRGLHSIAGTT
jgi:hypothetical protein